MCLGRMAKGEKVDGAKEIGSATEGKSAMTEHEMDDTTPTFKTAQQANVTEGVKAKKRRGKK